MNTATILSIATIMGIAALGLHWSSPPEMTEALAAQGAEPLSSARAPSAQEPLRSSATKEPSEPSQRAMSDSATSIQIATATITPDLDPNVSRDRMRRVIEEITDAHPAVRLILFGETILGWFHKPGETQEYHEAIAETIPGPTTNYMSELARLKDIYVSFGLSEKADNKLYNSQVIISPSGEIIAKHRKFWIRNPVFTAGEESATFAEVDGATVAILICADGRSFRLMRDIRRAKADIVLVGLADFGTDLALNRMMGTFYDAWTFTANRFGEEASITWNGLASVTDRWGRIMDWSVNQESILIQEVPLETQPSIKRYCRRLVVGVKCIGLALAMVVGQLFSNIKR